MLGYGLLERNIWGVGDLGVMGTFSILNYVATTR
jgi:hypothetical protein